MGKLPNVTSTISLLNILFCFYTATLYTYMPLQINQFPGCPFFFFFFFFGGGRDRQTTWTLATNTKLRSI